ncbi:MAG: methyltransferase domain-containing protein [Paracoccaceae bacterium]
MSQSTAIDTTAAQAYEDYLVSTLFGTWARKAVALAAPQPGETVLDLACGTGIGARLAAPCVSPGGTIISADSDAGMVEVGRVTAAAADLPADVTLEWHVAPMEIPVADASSVDLCLCLQGPNFAQDPAAGIAQIFAALKPGGRLVASFWNEYSTNKGHYAIGQALIARGMKAATKPFSLGDPALVRGMLESTGFEVEHLETGVERIPFPSARAFVDGVAAGAPATRHALAQLSPDDLDAFVDDVARQLEPYRTDDGLALPTSSHIVVARRPA